MPHPSVYVCVTTRDGTIRNDVLGAAITAVENARAAGLAADLGRQQFQYGTATCRNMAVARFLALPGFSHLLFLDDDNVLPPDGIVRLAETADAPGRDIVCGPYPSVKYTTASKSYLYITMMPKGPLGPDSPWLSEYPEGVTEIGAAGTGCMLIARHVLTALGHPWFRWPERYDESTGTVQTISDDIDFCASAAAKGFRVWADGRVRCGHRKTIDLASLLDGSIHWRGGPPASLADGYASHAPALRAVARAVPVRTAVEFGSGRYSTPLFLDRAAFPDLERLLSVESDPQWARDTRHRCGHDQRLLVDVCPIDRVHEAEAFPRPDLVFIDCDSVKGDRHDFTPRVRLLERYQTDPHAVVVVHDANFAAVAPAVAASAFRHKATYVPPHGPHTAVLSNAFDVTTIPWGDA